MALQVEIHCTLQPHRRCIHLRKSLQ